MTLHIFYSLSNIKDNISNTGEDGHGWDSTEFKY